MAKKDPRTYSVYVNFRDEEHVPIKIAAAKAGKTIAVFCADAVREKLAKESE